jgi:hypothetical protein
MTTQEVIDAIKKAMRLETRRRDAERREFNEEIKFRRLHGDDPGLREFLDACQSAANEGFMGEGE